MCVWYLSGGKYTLADFPADCCRYLFLQTYLPSTVTAHLDLDKGYVFKGLKKHGGRGGKVVINHIISVCGQLSPGGWLSLDF